MVFLFDRSSGGLIRQIPDELILSVNQDHGRRDWAFTQFKTHDDDFFARLDEVCCGSVHADRTGTSLAEDDVGFQPGARVVAGYQDSLALDQAGLLDQARINRDAADVGEIRFSNGRLVYL